jgi:DNA-directed RNA polymerase specialized sigma24 family protein
VTKGARHDPNVGLEDSYKVLKPVFFRILWGLAQQGYVSDAGQGMDLIHDFFTEAWPGIAERYDPSLATLKVYAAAAFARFARPRLVREARWRRMLADDEARMQASDFDPAFELDMKRVRSAVSHLDPEDQNVLAVRFGQDSGSERRLAEAAGMSRYKYREKIAAALARFVAALGDRGSMAPEDFDIVLLIFGAGMSAEQVSVELSLPVEQIRAARRRVLRNLGIASTEVSK